MLRCLVSVFPPRQLRALTRTIHQLHPVLRPALKAHPVWSVPRQSHLFRTTAFARFASTETPTPTDSAISLTPDPTVTESIASSAVLAETARAAGTWGDGFVGIFASTIQELINFIHNSGLQPPWWASIVLTTIALRGLALPFNLMALRNSRRMHNISPITNELQMQMREATATGDDARRMKLWQQMSETWKKYNCSPVKSIYGVAVVLPLFFSFYRALRSMADHAELWPGFTTGGLFWCQNLALPDPYYVLPVLTGLSMIASFEVGADGINTAQMGGRMVNVFRIMAAGSAVFSCFMPASVCFYWFTSNLISLSQVALIRVRKFRELLDIPEMIKHDRTQKVPMTPVIKPEIVSSVRRSKRPATTAHKQ